ncbi:MAG: Acetyl esterase/lipase [Marmoricola sp.]|nr:Acetyl esterase/lipase [Marmoricola sp.]
MDPAAFPNLDPELVEFVASLPDMGNALDDIPGARRMLASMMPAGPVPGEEDLDITDETAPGDPDVAVRVYRPRGSTGELPGLLYIHGGGFCIGDAASEQRGAVSLARRLGVVVVNVDYRLAPEDPHPAAIEDCYAALQYLAGLDGVDTSRLVVHGNSAGGGLAAATALMARDRGGPALCFQSLGIPVLDDRLGTPSMTTFVDTPLWSRKQAAKSWELYLAGVPADQYAAPARATDLTGLPPAYVLTCELDPLRDEGLTYAMRLLAAGVSTEVHNLPGAFHGTSIVPSSAVAKRMDAELLVVLARALGVTIAR